MVLTLARDKNTSRMPSEPSRKPIDHPNSDALIEVDHVTFGYEPGRSILRDVSMRFGRGQVTGILGGSGCGKTTVLRLIGGVHPVGTGSVRFDGEIVDTRNAEQLYRLRRRLGMLFQFGALFTDLSVFENVAFPLREHTDLDDLAQAPVANRNGFVIRVSDVASVGSGQAPRLGAATRDARSRARHCIDDRRRQQPHRGAGRGRTPCRSQSLPATEHRGRTRT